MTSFKLVHYCSLAVKDVAISLKIGQPERETARGLTGWSKGQEEERVWGGDYGGLIRYLDAHAPIPKLTGTQDQRGHLLLVVEAGWADGVLEILAGTAG